MSYRVELSVSNRAGCRNAECKDNAIKIAKGELRLGTMVVIKDNQSWHWKHWGCTTPKVICNWRMTAEDGDGDYDTEMIDGYEDLPEAHQEKVLRALRQGHVDDEDWNGDPEKNVVGANGFRMHRTPKKKPAEEGTDGEAPAGSPVEEKKLAKKRARAVKEEDGDDAEEPKPKKSRARAKKVKSEDADEHADDAADEPEPKAKKPRSRAKKVKAEDADEDATKEPKPKKARGRAKKIKEEDADEVDHDENADDPADEVPEKPKKTAKPRASRKKAASVKEEEVDDEEGEAPAEPVARKARGRPKKAVAPKQEDVDEDDEKAEAAAPPPKKTRGRPKKVTAAEEVEEQPEEPSTEEVVVPDVDEVAGVKPKAKRGRKKA